MAYSLLIHLRGVRDHRAALSSIVSAWHDTFRFPILFFSNKGPGRPPDAAFVQERAAFGRLDDGISVRLRESRKLKAPQLEVYFTNPARAFYGDLNFAAASLPATWLASVGPTEAERAVVDFVSAVEGLGALIDASFGDEDVTLQSPGYEINRAISVAYGCNMGQIAYFNRSILLAHDGECGLSNSGFTVKCTWPHGSLASLPIDPASSSVNAAWSLFAALEAFGLFRRCIEPALLSEPMPTLAEVGGFLGAFEERFGRVFAVQYQDGLRPLGSA